MIKLSLTLLECEFERVNIKSSKFSLKLDMFKKERWYQNNGFLACHTRMNGPS